MRRILVFGLALVAGLASTAPAAGLPGRTGSFGVHGAYLKAADAEDGDAAAGAHFEILLGRLIGIRGEANYHGEESYAIQPADDNGTLTVQTVSLGASGRFYLPVDLPIVPYATAGAAWYQLNYDVEDSPFDLEEDSESTFGWHIGAGAVLAVSERLGLFGEFRAVFMDPDKKLGEDVQDQIEDLDFDKTMIQAGVSYYFSSAD
jgi:opacity protein-like surface antigen